MMRLLLEAYYEPQFSDRSHGFRPGRGCHTALTEVARPIPHADQAILIERTVRDPDDGRLRFAVAALGITSRPATRGGTPEAGPLPSTSTGT